MIIEHKKKEVEQMGNKKKRVPRMPMTYHYNFSPRERQILDLCMERSEACRSRGDGELDQLIYSSGGFLDDFGFETYEDIPEERIDEFVDTVVRWVEKDEKQWQGLMGEVPDIVVTQRAQQRQKK